MIPYRTGEHHHHCPGNYALIPLALCACPPGWLDRREMVTQEHLDNWFQYHAPVPEQIPKYEAIREAGKNLATVILENTPSSADQSAAIRQVREAVMTANASIACEGR